MPSWNDATRHAVAPADEPAAHIDALPTPLIALLLAGGALSAAARGARRPTDGTAVASITIRNRLDDLRRVSAMCDRFARRTGLDETTRIDLQVVLDEIVSNAIRHAFRDDRPHRIAVALAGDPTEVAMRIEYAGVEFDPTRPRAAPPDPLVPGGRGLPLVLGLLDDVRYVRDGGLNRIVAVRRRPPPPPCRDTHGHR